MRKPRASDLEESEPDRRVSGKRTALTGLAVLLAAIGFSLVVANAARTQDRSEPSAVPPATQTWVLPVTTPGCEIKITNGGWIVAANGDRASFGGNAKADEDGNVTGQEEYQDRGPAMPFNLHGNVLVVVCNSATSATIFGEATIDGSGSHTYRIDVQDNAEPGKGADRYRMRVNAYDSGDQVLRGGNIQIHRADDGGGGGDRAYCAPPGPATAAQCGSGHSVFDFDASSGPLGENPTGTGLIESIVFPPSEYQVTCLQVAGNTASIGGVITNSSDPDIVGFGITFTVVDNTPVAADLISVEQFLEPFQVPAANTPNCGSELPPTSVVNTGDIVVQDNTAGGG